MSRLIVGRFGFLLAFVAVFALLNAVVLTGCSPEPEDDGADESVVAEETVEHEAVTVRVAAPVALQGVLEELASAYTAENEWLSFDIQVYTSAKSENEAITPTTPAVSEEEAQTAEPAEADSSSASSEDAPEQESEEAADEPALLPEAGIVFQNSLPGMKGAEEVGAVDLSTRADMLADGLAIVASADAAFNSATVAEIEAGSHPLAVVEGNSVFAKRQYEALSNIGVYADGAFTGYYAQAQGAVKRYESAADLFAAVAKDDKLVAIVRTSDVYRYGGVNVVGAVPARMYSPMVFPQALGVNLTLLENGQQVDEAARGFLQWVATDETALGIIEKWGFHFTA